MNIGKLRAIGGALIMTVGLLSGAAAVADRSGDEDSDDRGQGRSDACFRTTQSMYSACRADVLDDFYEQSAKCLNSDEGRRCRRDARQELMDARGECTEQADSRDSLCDRLPDAGPYIIDINPDDFDAGTVAAECAGGNRFFPLVVGTVTTFVNDADEEELETIIVTITDETREIQGVNTTVVRDTVYEGLPDEEGEPTGDRIEDTDDYYALDRHCNVWYFGEVSQNFEEGYLDNLDGSFIAGVEGAQAGIIMQGDPQPGDVYRQEFALGDAEDAGEVLELGAVIFDEEMEPFEFENPAFNCAEPGDMCLKTEDFIGNEPDGTEFKYFKPGIGFVAEQLPEGEIVLRLIKVEPALP